MPAPASFPTRHQVNKSLLPSGRCRTVAVTVRLRPPNESELNGGERRAVFVGGDGTVAKVRSPAPSVGFDRWDPLKLPPQTPTAEEGKP